MFVIAFFLGFCCCCCCFQAAFVCLGHVSHLKAKTHLIAANAVFGKLLIVAGTAVNIAAFGEEALRSYWPFAAVTGEAVIVPRVSFVLNSLCAWKNIPDVMNNEIRENSNKNCKSVVHLPKITSGCTSRCMWIALLCFATRWCYFVLDFPCSATVYVASVDY